MVSKLKKSEVKKFGKRFLYLFEDLKLKAEEESTFIGLVKEGKKRKKEYEMTSKCFGKISFLSDMSTRGEEIYLMYKDRESIEVAFDALKNELENDKTYLRDDEAVRGYFFVSFLSLYMYYKVLNKLKEKKLSHKISVSDLLFELSKVYEIHFDKKKKFSEIPKKVEDLVEILGMDIFPLM
jgi:transposase